MIGLLPVKVSMTTKEQITLSRSGERAKTSGHFYGRFGEFVGCRTRAVTGGSGANGIINYLQQIFAYVVRPVLFILRFRFKFISHYSS